MDRYTIRPIAHVRSDYNQKFGIPRQAGLVESLEQAIVIDPAFRNIDAVRGLEGFSRIWLIWGFSNNPVDMTRDPVRWSPTVRPPRLKGKIRKGVWASRSPYRPNSLGMSNVRLLRIMLGDRVLYDAARDTDVSGPQPSGVASSSSGAASSSAGTAALQYIDDPSSVGGETNEELVLIVSGADMLNGTPVFDIKPYIPYSDSHPEANPGYSVDKAEFLDVVFPEELLSRIDPSRQNGLIRILELDPRDAYDKKDGNEYRMSFADWDIRFTVSGSTLTVTDVCPL